jgi:hypothetical protein
MIQVQAKSAFNLQENFMIRKRLLITITVLLVAQPTFAQFGATNNRLSDLAGRLSREANDFADSNYRSFTNSSQNRRNDIEAVMLTQQFGAASQIFYRMVVDRRRNSELRDAFDLLQTLSRAVERNNLQRSTWYNIQRLMTDVGREIGESTSENPQYPDNNNRGGRMTWKGRVDDDIRITIRGGGADVQTIGGTPYYDAQPNFSSSLPNRRVTVRLVKNRGRGDIFIEQQPSRDNDFAVVIRIKDPKGGASDYEFELTW